MLVGAAPVPKAVDLPLQVAIVRLRFFTRAIICLKIAECILNSREHMRHEWPQKVNTLIVAVRFVKHTAIANVLNVAYCVIAVRASRCG